MARYIPYSWYRYPEDTPPDTGDYLCVILSPNGDGKARKQQCVVHYTINYIGRFDCDWGIVTHWMLPIVMP